VRELHALGASVFEISTEHLVELERTADLERAVAAVLETLASLHADAPQAHALLEADVSNPDPHQRAEDLQRIQRHIAIAARIGVRVVVVHPGGRYEAITNAERDRLLALNRNAFRRLGDRAAELGLRLALENLFRPWAATPEEMEAILAVIDHPAVGVALDTSHANVAGLDLPTLIRRFEKRLLATHISDNDGSGDQHRTPGYGRINWPPVMAALAEIGCAGPFNLEIPGERHPLMGLRRLKGAHALTVARWLLALAS